MVNCQLSIVNEVGRGTAVIIPIPKTLQFVCTQFAAEGLGFVLDWRR